MKVTLKVNGREIIFSEQELVSILEEYFRNKKIPVPTEGVWYKVTPSSIDQNLFKQERKDSSQEKTRKLILEAFEEIKNEPSKARNFIIGMPGKTFSTKTVDKLRKSAKQIGDRNANWIEQALQWAQRINNGESWEDVCNKPDTANWYRLVIWKNGYAKCIGGALKVKDNSPASTVRDKDYSSTDVMNNCIPLIVSYR